MSIHSASNVNNVMWFVRLFFPSESDQVSGNVSILVVVVAAFVVLALLFLFFFLFFFFLFFLFFFFFRILSRFSSLKTLTLLVYSGLFLVFI